MGDKVPMNVLRLEMSFYNKKDKIEDHVLYMNIGAKTYLLAELCER